MAGDWIKHEKGLPRKREVILIAGELQIHPYHATGALEAFWEWCDDNILDDDIDRDTCHATVTLSTRPLSDIDATAAQPGLGAAMEKVGWVKVDGDRLVIIHYGRHNGNTAKTRALASKRKAKERNKTCDERDTCHGNSVTSSVTKTSLEKRESIEKSNTTPTKAPMRSSCLRDNLSGGTGDNGGGGVLNEKLQKEMQAAGVIAADSLARIQGLTIGHFRMMLVDALKAQQHDRLIDPVAAVVTRIRGDGWREMPIDLKLVAGWINSGDVATIAGKPIPNTGVTCYLGSAKPTGLVHDHALIVPAADVTFHSLGWK